MLPVDPEKKDDVYYRYKMPAVQVKVEGSGNGIKTVIPNIHDVCAALNRPEEVLMRFLSLELGAQSTITKKDDKYLLMGKFTDERMQELIYLFIGKFVLCTGCRNPETTIELNTKREEEPVRMKCGACGATTRMDWCHRAYTSMCQHYKKHPSQAKSGKGTAEGRRKEEEAGEQERQQREGGAAAPEAGPLAAQAAPAEADRKKAGAVEKSDIADNRRNPMEVFTGYMKEAEAASAAAEGKKGLSLSAAALEALSTQAVRLSAENNLDETYICRLMLTGIFSLHKACPMAAIKAYAPILRRFSTCAELHFSQETFDERTTTALQKREGKIQRVLIRQTVAELVAGGPEAAQEKIAIVLFLFFIEGILKDSSILNYVTEKKPTDGVDPAVDAVMKRNALQVTEWLGVRKESA